MKVSVPLRGFWYADAQMGEALQGRNPWSQSPYGDFGTLTLLTNLIWVLLVESQSPYGDFGTLTSIVSFVINFIRSSQSPYGDFGTLTFVV